MRTTNPTFTVQDLHAAIPTRCFQPSMARSFAYLIFDLALIAGLYAALTLTNAWYIEWPILFLIGTLLWSLFVIGHDAGHGSFSSNRTVNTIWNLHVVHHLFPTIPHYRLQEATDAIKPILGEYYRSSDRFVVTEFISSQLRCHFVVPDEGFERYGSAYKWMKPKA